MDYKLFAEYFAIDPSSPSGLSWIKDYFTKRGAQFGFSNKPAGRMYDKGYWRIGFKGSRYEIHRIIYLLANGSIDDQLEVDHIDGNPSNNNLCNLRLVSKLENLANRKQKSSTGVTGVYFNRRKTSVCSHWQEEGVTKFSKTFNISVYGLDEAIELAKSVRDVALGNKIK